MTYAVFALLSLIWGSTWLAIKIGLEDSPPLWSAGFRFVIACLILFTINRLRRVEYPRDWRRLGAIAFPGIFMYGFSYMLVYWGEMHIGSSLMAVLFSSFPFFVAALSVTMLPEERLSHRAWGGLIIGFAGIVVIFYDSLQISQLVFSGTLAGVAGAAMSAFATVYVRSRLTKCNIRVMAILQMTLGAILILLTAAVLEPLSAFKITARSISALFYLAILGTVVAFLGYYWLLQRMQAIRVAVMTFLIPLIALLLGYIVRDETLSTATLCGTVLIVSGIALVLRK